jgi:hypothetical protein
MPKGLVRYQQCGCFHFITFSCHHRLPHLGRAAARSLFERSPEAMRLERAGQQFAAARLVGVCLIFELQTNKGWRLH